MSVFIDGVNLTRMSDKQLSAITAKLLQSSEVAERVAFMERYLPNQITARKAVKRAQTIIQAWLYVNTVTTASEPSPESFAWSNLEGGHIFHREPSFADWLDSEGFER